MARVALQELQQLHRRRVGPLQVVEEEHQRLGRRRGPDEQLQHRVEHVELRRALVGTVRVGVDQSSERLAGPSRSLCSTRRDRPLTAAPGAPAPTATARACRRRPSTCRSRCGRRGARLRPRASRGQAVLPTPGSPEMSTSRPMPAAASSSAGTRRRSGRSRPTSCGGEHPRSILARRRDLAAREIRSRAYRGDRPPHERCRR